ncbi:MAG: hypothetical protein ACPGWR_17030 [Ardenticatenaceae bacterium]
MAKLIWFNQPTNHSGWINFFYLAPDGDVGKFDIYMADSGGCYLLGGPLLTYDGFEWMDSAMTLMSFLPAGFHFFPKSSTKIIREVVEENRDHISDDDCAIESEEWYDIHVYSNAYSTTQSCDMLLNGTTPESPVVFMSRYEDGHVLLAAELARIYYGLSKEQREELGLKADWRHSFS